MFDNAAPRDGDDSSQEPLGEAGLSALRKLRVECRELRSRLRDCEGKRGAIRVVAWRPASDPRSPLLGWADIALGDLVVLDVRLVRLDGGFVLSWPARKRLGSAQLIAILRVGPGLDGRALAAVLEHAFPETAVELPG